MFSGLSNLFKAFRRLTAEVNETADLWKEANGQLRQRLAIDDEAEPVVDAKRNGSAKRIASHA
jgi:hypothetical protein